MITTCASIDSRPRSPHLYEIPELRAAWYGRWRRFKLRTGRLGLIRWRRFRIRFLIFRPACLLRFWPHGFVQEWVLLEGGRKTTMGCPFCRRVWDVT